jgi:excinuclease ABC subunit A
MGPEGGINGGEIIAEGTPEKVSQVEKSYTGNFIKGLLGTTSMKKTA